MRLQCEFESDVAQHSTWLLGVLSMIASSSISEITWSLCFQVCELIVVDTCSVTREFVLEIQPIWLYLLSYLNRKCTLAAIQFIFQNHLALMFSVTRCR